MRNVDLYLELKNDTFSRQVADNVFDIISEAKNIAELKMYMEMYVEKTSFRVVITPKTITITGKGNISRLCKNIKKVWIHSYEEKKSCKSRSYSKGEAILLDR